MLSPGTWVITAKIVVVQGDLDEDRVWAWCRLHAGGVVDEAKQSVVGATAQVTLPMQIMATVAAGGDLGAYLDCRDGDMGDTTGDHLSIIAIRVGG